MNQSNTQALLTVDRFMHNWGRVLGRIGKLYIPQKQDDSNTNLRWNAKTNQLEGRFFKTSKGNYYAAFNIVNQSLFVATESHDVAFEKDVANTSLNVILNDLLEFLARLGLDINRFTPGLTLRFPNLLDASGIMENPNQDALARWGKLRAAANEKLADVLKEFSIESEIRIWPTNFDTAIHFDYGGIDQFNGFNPADGINDVPYFYTSFYRNFATAISPRSDFDELTHGTWRADYWHGAVLPVTDFDNDEDLINAVTQFYSESTASFLKHINETK